MSRYATVSSTDRERFALLEAIRIGREDGSLDPLARSADSAGRKLRMAGPIRMATPSPNPGGQQ